MPVPLHDRHVANGAPTCGIGRKMPGVEDGAWVAPVRAAASEAACCAADCGVARALRNGGALGFGFAAAAGLAGAASAGVPEAWGLAVLPADLAEAPSAGCARSRIR